MSRESDRGVVAIGLVTLTVSALLGVRTIAERPDSVPQDRSRSVANVGGAVAELPEICQRARARAESLRAEFDAAVPATVKMDAATYLAKPDPGVSLEKAWGDYAAAALLAGEASVGAWAGLTAALTAWRGETVTNAGIYLHHVRRLQDALQFLNCSYEMGYRSPHLLEALAVVQSAMGNSAEARRQILQAVEAAPDDVLIETEASFMTTGGPPPSRPAPRDPDGLDAAIRELDQQLQRALNLTKAEASEIERSIKGAQTQEYYKSIADTVPTLVATVHELARQARTAQPSVRPIMVNSVLSTAITTYIQITDELLSFPETTTTVGSPLLFWADVLGIDPPLLHREQEGGWTEPVRWSMHGLGPALAQPAATIYFREKEAGDKDHRVRQLGCNGSEPCLVRENGRWCGVRQQLFEPWENASRQRHNAAARAFDRIATGRLLATENEYLQARDYAVRQLKKMRFPPPVGGVSFEQMTIQAVNISIKALYDHHLGADAGSSSGMISYLREQALWFEGERAGMDESLGREADEIHSECAPVMRALLELVAQEQWQAYLDHLKDRLTWDVDTKTESNFPCEGMVGPLTVEADLNKPGEGKLDLKWKRKGVMFSGGGNLVIGRGGITPGVSAGLGKPTGVGADEDGQGVSIAGIGMGDSTLNGGVGGSAGYGPFSGKWKVSLTTKVSPWDGSEYLGIKLKGSAGLGLSARKGNLGVRCFPSSGSVTIYPRSLYQDAVKYLSTPAGR